MGIDELLALRVSVDGSTAWDFAGSMGRDFPPLRLLVHPTLGRHAVAGRRILAGELIFTDTPFVQSVHDNFVEHVCHWCYKFLDAATPQGEKYFTCENCSTVRFCSMACKQALSSIHAQECSLLQDIGARGGSTLQLYHRLLRRAVSEPDAFAEVESMSHHYDDATKERQATLDTAAHGINCFLPQSIQMESRRVACLVDRVHTNAYSIAGPDGVTTGTGLYCKAGSFFNHSCAPSAVVSFLGRTLRIHAIRNLEAGEEVSISYTELYASRAVRQAALSANKGFTCVCTRCVEPSAGDLDLEGWACASSRCSVGVVPREGTACAACGTRHALKPEARAAMEQRWQDDVDNWWQVLPGGGYAELGITTEDAAMRLLPKLDQLLAATAGRLSETHALRHKAFVLRSHAVGVCARAPPAALVEAIEDCLRGMRKHLPPANPYLCSFVHRHARALMRQAEDLRSEDPEAAKALSLRAWEAAHAAAQRLAIGWGTDHPIVKEWRATAASLEGVAPPADVWEPLEGFDEFAFLMTHWPGWGFDGERVAAFRKAVRQLNQQMGKPSQEPYQGGLRLKIRTPPFIVFEGDWAKQLSDVVDVPALRRLVADLRTHHSTILAEYTSVPDAQLSDSGTHMLTSGRRWLEAFPSHMPCLRALLKRHESILLPVQSDSLSQGSISILWPGAVSKVHTGQFNMRLRLHYPLSVPSVGPELAGADRSYGNPWAKGPFLIDDAQLHAVRNTGDDKRCIVLCDILRKDVPRVSPSLMAKMR